MCKISRDIKDRFRDLLFFLLVWDQSDVDRYFEYSIIGFKKIVDQKQF